MRSVKRWLGGLLCLALLLTALPTAAWAAEGELSDGTEADSTAAVTRAELAEMVMHNTLLGGNVRAMANPSLQMPFEDLNGYTDEQKSAIEALYQAQIITGTSATQFDPSKEVTLGEALVVIWRAAGSRANSTAWEASEYYIDADEFEDWYAPAVNCFYGAGLIKGEKPAEGEEKPEFGGNTPVTIQRAQALINKFKEDSNDYKDFMDNTEEGAVTRASMLVEFYERFAPELSALPVTDTGEQCYASFPDIGGCTGEQLEAIQFFTERGLVQGTSAGGFSPFVPVPNFQVALLLMRCAKKQTAAAEATVTEDGGTMSQSVVSMALDNSILEQLKGFFGEGSPVVKDVSYNPDAPALLNDMTTWSESLRPAAPALSPSGGQVSENTQVTITAKEGETLCYTTDGSDPAAPENDKRVYSAGNTVTVTISSTTTVRAVAVKNNLYSTEVSATYTVPVLTITPDTSSLTGGGTVTLTVTNIPAGATASVTCTSSSGGSITVTPGTSTTWTATLPNADGTYTFTVTAGSETATCIVTVTCKSTTSSTGGTTSRPSSNTTTSTERNPDGSTTTTTTNKATGTVTETTRYPDGSREVVETKKDGTVTTTSTDADGNETEVVEKPDGSSETTIQNADGSSSTTTVSEDGAVETAVKLPSSVVEDAQGAAIALPMPAVRAERERDDAPTVTVDLPRNASVPVEIPVENAGTSTVAVLVKADGTEEVIKTSLTTENGVAVSLSDGDTVKIVDNGKTFYDVPGSHWGAEAIDFVTSRELFGGTSAVTFEPDVSMNRGMLVTVLYRLENELNTWGGGSYTDVPEGMYYTGAVAWADVNGIVTGYADATFAPGRDITREEMAVVLYRYAQHKGYDTDQGGMAIREYADYGRINTYAQEAMAWANASGLITGDGGMLNPQGSATRAQVATILQRFLYLING